MMYFTYPYLFALVLLPFLLVFILPAIKGMHGDAIRFPFMAEIKLIKVSSVWSANKTDKLYGSKFWLMFLVWCFFVCAICRPVYTSEPVKIKTQGRQILLVTDISTSMLEEDFKLNNRWISRLDAIKKVISDFIAKRPNDDIGLIVFGTNSYMQSPLTYDKSSVIKMLNNIEAGMAGNSTAIGDALALSLKKMRSSPNMGNKAIILLTDGENNDGLLNMQQGIELAEQEGIKVYTIGVGKASVMHGGLWGALYPSNPIDEKSLQKLANVTNGQFFKAQDMSSLQKIYDRIDKLEADDKEPTYVVDVQEVFYIPLLAGLLIWFALQTLFYRRHKC